jgi:hypothetical protein
MLRIVANISERAVFQKQACILFSVSLVGAFLPGAFAPTVAAMLANALPAIGQTVGMITMPIFGGIVTLSMGALLVRLECTHGQQFRAN